MWGTVGRDTIFLVMNVASWAGVASCDECGKLGSGGIWMWGLGPCETEENCEVYRVNTKGNGCSQKLITTARTINALVTGMKDATRGSMMSFNDSRRQSSRFSACHKIRPLKNQTIRQKDCLITPTVTAEIRLGTSYSLVESLPHICFEEMRHAKTNPFVEHCGLLWRFALTKIGVTAPYCEYRLRKSSNYIFNACIGCYTHSRADYCLWYIAHLNWSKYPEDSHCPSNLHKHVWDKILRVTTELWHHLFSFAIMFNDPHYACHWYDYIEMRSTKSIYTAFHPQILRMVSCQCSPLKVFQPKGSGQARTRWQWAGRIFSMVAQRMASTTVQTGCWDHCVNSTWDSETWIILSIRQTVNAKNQTLFPVPARRDH